MTSSTRGHLVRVAVSLLALGVILFSLRDRLGECLRIIRHEVSVPVFGLVVPTYFLANMILAVRLRAIFAVQAVRLKLGEVLHLVFVGLFFNLFLPSAVGGDLAKAYYAYKHSGKKIASTTSVILDRLIGFASLMLLALIAILIFSKSINDVRVDQLIFVFMGFMLVVVLFFASKQFARNFKFVESWVPAGKWRDGLKEIYHAIYGYKNHAPVLIFSLVLSLLGQFLFILAYYFAAVSLGLKVNLWTFLIVVPIISIVSMAPSLGGLGVREAGSILLFRRFMSTEHALALSVLMDVMIYGFGLVAGIWYAIHGGLRRKVMHEMEELTVDG